MAGRRPFRPFMGKEVRAVTAVILLGKRTLWPFDGLEGRAADRGTRGKYGLLECNILYRGSTKVGSWVGTSAVGEEPHTAV
jgi:hypothetical protein